MLIHTGESWFSIYYNRLGPFAKHATTSSGRSRSGKGLHLEAQLLSWPASAIVNDIKGELHHRTAGFRESEKGFGGKVFVFRPKGNGHRHDPLEGLTTEFDLQSAAT